jgi:hypothetical protein
MSELTGAYAAFGYTPAAMEPPDHVAVEVGFIAYLRFKEAYAVASADPEHAALTQNVAEQFRTQHVATMGAPLAAALAGSGIDYLVAASSLRAARAPRPRSVQAGHAPPRTRLPVIQDPIDDEGDGEFSCGDNRP